MSQVKQVTAQLLKQTLTSTTIPVLVDFFATWCPPCRALAPVLDDVAAHFSGKVEFLKVNIDDEPTLAEQFQVEAVPTLVLIQQGSIVHHSSGAPTRQALLELLNRATNTSSDSPV